jgi:hypothetical protein
VSRAKALASFWKDRLTATEQREITKPNGATGFEEVAILENQPCKLSFSTLAATNQQDMTAAVVQTAKLFCGKALRIAPGSKITVTRGGNAFEFGQSGLPGVFEFHQEIGLVPWDGWA